MIMLKSDDFRLIDTLLSHRTCTEYDVYALEGNNHVVMQCPSIVEIRTKMFDDIESILIEFDKMCQEHPSEVFRRLLAG